MRNIVKIGLTACLMLGLNSFANDTLVNKLYVDNATKDGLINHYKTISSYITNGRIELVKIEKIYDFKFPIYKVEYVKEYYKDGVEKYVDIDYIEVDNNRFFASLRENLNYDRKDFEFYKINNFEQLLPLCRYEQKCIQLKLGTFDKEHNLSFEKIKLNDFDDGRYHTYVETNDKKYKERLLKNYEQINQK